MQSHTWIFSLAAPISADNRSSLMSAFDVFQAQWQSHGTPVNGLIQVKHDRFVVIQAKADESRPSGCSIDSLRRGVTTILQQHRLTWLEGGEVFYHTEAGEIEMVHFQHIPSLVANGALTADTTVFDHSLSHTDDLDKWEVPMSSTWMKRYLPSDEKQKV